MVSYRVWSQRCQHTLTLQTYAFFPLHLDLLFVTGSNEADLLWSDSSSVVDPLHSPRQPVLALPPPPVKSISQPRETAAQTIPVPFCSLSPEASTSQVSCPTHTSDSTLLSLVPYRTCETSIKNGCCQCVSSFLICSCLEHNLGCQSRLRSVTTWELFTGVQ